MPSSFTWMDHSEEDRRRVLDAVATFYEPDTRDELGLGVIRDRYADLLFPGTSTVQTRARYFLFVPWMYRALAQKGVRADRVTARARKEEIGLRDSLVEAGETDGVIGMVAGASLKRLPSSVYWQGLGAWGIRTFRGSQDEYHRHFGQLDDVAGQDDDGEPLDDQSLVAWHPHLPPAPEGFPVEASLALTTSEAEFLTERMTLSAPDSMLAFLVQRPSELDAAYIWDHRLRAEFPESLTRIVDHCQLFSEVMHGAAFLYNLMLAEQLPVGVRRDETVEGYREDIEAWVEELAARNEAFETWDRDDFWRLTRSLGQVSGGTHRLVEQWVRLKPWRPDSRIASNVAARGLIRDRERQLKGPAARIGNARATELWSGRSGTNRLSFRWPAARRILADLFGAE